MGTKTLLLFASWIISYISNQLIPPAMVMVYFTEISVVSVATGACMGYNLWLLWHDQEMIILGIQSLWEFESKRIADYFKTK